MLGAMSEYSDSLDAVCATAAARLGKRTAYTREILEIAISLWDSSPFADRPLNERKIGKAMARLGFKHQKFEDGNAWVICT